ANDMPHFGLATAPCGLFIFCSVRVVGMHLNRKLVVREKEFYKDRELRIGTQVGTAPLRWHAVPAFSQRTSPERPVGNSAIPSGQPSLAERLLQICLLGEKGRKRACAPEAGTEDWLNSRWHGLRHGQEAASAREKNLSKRPRPSSMRSMDAAYDKRKKPGAPNASPGTSATWALSRRSFANSVQVLAWKLFPSPR